MTSSKSWYERAVIVYSILGGYALNDIEPWAYLDDVLRRIVDGWPMSGLQALLPRATPP